MFESLGFETLTAPQAAVWFGLIVGIVFGALAERTRFCLRRALIGEDRRAAGGVWLIALAAALLGTQGAVALGWIDFAGNRFLAPDLPVLAIVAGGLMFGIGMVLTRGCISRLTVLAATGNLRAALCVLLFAVAAHATMKGALAPLAQALSAPAIPLGEASSLAALPGGAAFWTLALALPALAFALRSGNHPLALAGGIAIGLLVPLSWVGTGLVLYDDFDPIPMASLGFTGPHTETLFWTIAGTAVPPGFGTGLVGGTLLGAFATARAFGVTALLSFTAPRQTLRYGLGALMMGSGGVLAGGCTVGAGLAGVPTLGVAALLALAAIVAGGLLGQALLGRDASVPSLVPAR